MNLVFKDATKFGLPFSFFLSLRKRQFYVLCDILLNVSMYASLKY